MLTFHTLDILWFYGIHRRVRILQKGIAKFTLMFSRFQIILDTASDIRFSIDRDFGGSVVFGAQEQNDDELWMEEEDEIAREWGALGR